MTMINEVFNSSSELKITADTPNSLTAVFHIQNRQYTVVAYDDTWEDEDTCPTWRVEFSLGGTGSEGEYHLTNDNVPFSVFSSVIQCVKIVLNKHPEIGQLVFTAEYDTPKRVALYRSMIRRIAQILPGWQSNGEEEGGFQHFFKLMRSNCANQ